SGARCCSSGRGCCTWCRHAPRSAGRPSKLSLDNRVRGRDAQVTPEDLKYTEEHEWIARRGDTTVRVGITDYAQDQLGEVVYVQLPEVGQRVDAGAPAGEVESTKSVSE